MVMQQSRWNCLSPDILADILAKLDARDCGTVRLACRAWHQAAKATAPCLRPKLLLPCILDAFPGLVELDLSSCRFQTEDLALLKGLTCLRSLTLQLHDADSKHMLQQASKLPNLSNLHLISLMADEGTDISLLTRLDKLEHLKMTAFSEAQSGSLAVLAGWLTKLTHLQVHRRTPEAFLPAKVSELSCKLLVARLPRLVHLDLHDLVSSSLDSLSSLTACQDLKALRLSSRQALDGAGVAAIGQLTTLTELELRSGVWCVGRHKPFTAGCVAQLGGLNGLQMLTIQGCNWQHLKPLLSTMSKLSCLTYLELSGPKGSRGCKADAEVLGNFCLEQLSSLKVCNSHWWRGSLSLLQRANQLKHLDLSDCSTITAADLQYLSGMSRLQLLCVNDCDLLSPRQAQDWECARNLGRLTNLEWANKYRTPSCFFADADANAGPRVAALLDHALCLTNLQRLSIVQQSLCPATPTLEHLGMLTQLTELDLTGTFCEEGADFDEALKGIAPLTGLQQLRIAATHVHAAGLHVIAHFTKLTALDLSRTPVGDHDLHLLEPLGRLRKLSVNDQRCHEALTDASLRTLARLSSLRSLSLRGNCALSSQGLAKLSCLPLLAVLDLRGALNICAPQALRSLQGCTALTELLLGDPGGACHPPFCVPVAALHQSEITACQAKLPFLQRIVFGGEVVTSRRAYLQSYMQGKLHSLLLDLGRIYICVVAKYHAATAMQSGYLFSRWH